MKTESPETTESSGRREGTFATRAQKPDVVIDAGARNRNPASSGQDPDPRDFERILDAIDDLVLVKDEHSRISWANRAFREWYGMSNEELSAIIDSAAVDPDATAHYLRDDLEVIETGVTLDVPSEPVTRHDGEVRYFHTRKSPLLDARGKATGLVAVARRIVEGEDAAEKRHRSQKSTISELKILVGHLPNAVVMFDARLYLLAASDRWFDTFPASRPDSDPQAGKPESSHRPHLGSLIEELRLEGEVSAALHQGQNSASKSIDFEAADGSRRSGLAVIRPWRWPDGPIGGAILQVHDITEQIRTERSLAAANDELAHFNYRVSHDLVAPLRTARGLLAIADSAHRSANSEQLESMLSRLDDSLTKLDKTLSRVVDLARSDFESHPVETVDLARLVHETLAAWNERLQSQSFHVDIDLACTRIGTEEPRLAQILGHLVQNAVHHADPRADEQWLRITSRQDGQAVLVFVANSGTPFPAEKHFDPFAAFSRGSSHHPGSGLGLYLVQKQVRALGGEVRARSDDSGVLVRLRLPDLRPSISSQ